MCYNPILVKTLQKDKVPVPCGKCPKCAKRRISAWSFRLVQEDKVSLSSWFITLTYDTKYLPFTRNYFATLDKRDLQLFYKRLRKLHEGDPVWNKPIKYYSVGEYGSETRRPHYHVILFNADVERIQRAWSIFDEELYNRTGKKVFHPIGHVHYGTVSEASVGYTLKYISKPMWRPDHRNDDRLPQFSLMSKGLGASYVSDNIKRWHHDVLEERMHCVLLDGKKVTMPRYYKDRIYCEVTRDIASKASIARMHEKVAEEIGKFGSPMEYEEALKVNVYAAHRRAALNPLKTVV